MYKIKTLQANPDLQTADQRSPGDRGGVLIGKGHKKLFRSDGNDFYLDCGDGLTGVYTCQILSNRIFFVFEVYFKCHTLARSLKKKKKNQLSGGLKEPK